MKQPFSMRDLILFLMEYENVLRKEPLQLCQGWNWFIAHESAPTDGFQITGDPVTHVVDDLTGRKETFRILIKDNFEPPKSKTK